MVALGRNTEVLNLKECTQKYKPTAAIKCKDVCRFVHVHGQNYWLLYEPQKVFCVVPKIKLIKAFSRSKNNNFCRQKAQNTSERLSLLRIYDSLFFPTIDHLSYGDCLETGREDNQNCRVLCFCMTHKDQ